MLKLRKLALAMLSAGLLAGIGTAQAATINQGLTAGALNTIADQDLEAFIDNGDEVLGLGDVLIGVVRLDDFSPSGLSANNQVYGVISNQVVGVNGNSLIFGTTTVAGLTLQELTGNVNTAGAMFAIYDRAVDFSTNLVTNAPGGAVSMLDYIGMIVAEGTLRLTAGIAGAADYLITDQTAIAPPGTSTGAFPFLPVSAEASNYTGGFSVLYNNTDFLYAPTVLTFDVFGNPHLTQIGLANGAARGMDGDGNEDIWGFVPGFSQCNVEGQNRACGFVTDADFFAQPYRIPEPGVLALFGVSMLGLFGVRRLSSKANS